MNRVTLFMLFMSLRLAMYNTHGWNNGETL